MPVSSTMNHQLAVPWFCTDRIKSPEEPRQLTEILCLSVIVHIRGNVLFAVPSAGYRWQCWKYAAVNSQLRAL